MGRDVRQVINDAVAKASVVILAAGRNWLGREEDAEQNRSHEQNDFVRAEAASALQEDKPVIPVLVAKSTMPSGSELPDDIESLAYRNEVNVRPGPDFARDVERRVRGIE